MPYVDPVTEHAGVVRISTFTTDGERWARLIEVLQGMSEQARAAEGCFGSQVCSIEDQPDAIAVVSRWRSLGDVDAFLAGRTEGARSALQDLLTGPPSTQYFTSLTTQ